MKRRIGFSLLIGTLLSTFGIWWGCSERREEGPLGVDMSLTYADVRPLLSAQCGHCHSGVDPAGEYDLSAYIGVLGVGSDEVSNAIAGDPNSLLLKTLETESHAHFVTEEEFARLRRWVVDDGLMLQQPGVHPPGWTAVDHDGFHGEGLEKRRRTYEECQACHGEDYRGGIAGRSCFSCHPGGPQICTTCHGNFFGKFEHPFEWAPPEDIDRHMTTTFRGVGAHQSHVRDEILHGHLDCAECHIVPTKVDDPGHMDSDLPAEITYGELARTEGAEPFWDTEHLQCRNVYCHGSFQYGSRDNAPIWTEVGTGQAACGTCHDLPPPSETGHPQLDQCSACHPSVVDENRDFKDLALHINGKPDVYAHPEGWVDVDHEGFHGKALAKTGWNLVGCQSCHGGDYGGGFTGVSCLTCHSNGPQACTTCHGNFPGEVAQAFNWAPPKDVSDSQETTSRGVGAHQMHVRYATLRVSLDCSECHIKPVGVGDPGHLDSDVPAEVTFGALARNEGSEPLWDAEGAQCNNVYCHGAFRFGNRDNRPIWTEVGVGQAACGTCHGLPPPAETGHVQVELGCTVCHSKVVDANGGIKDPTLHMNGRKD